MGCDLLGLDLGMLTLLPLLSYLAKAMNRSLTYMLLVVRNWEFLRHDFTNGGLGGAQGPLRLLGRRSSLVVADLPVQNMRLAMNSKPGSSSQRPPTMIQEPDANSLLDSFGF